MIQGPLNGIRILDLSRLLPGPLATQMMADMGAEVIKIEDKKAPDYTRFMPPHYNGVGVSFLALNRNKKSITLDFSDDKDKQKFFDLVKTADVVVDSFRPGVLKKLGIDYETAKQYNHSIIYVAVTGYGQDGVYNKNAGHDINYLGYSGVLSMLGDKEKIVKPGVQFADICGGSYPTVMACLAAVIHKKNTGEGQFVDVAMTDCVLPLLSFYMTEGLNTNKYYERQEHPLAGSVVNYNIYQCKDKKWMALGSLEPKFWMNFCMMVNKPEWSNQLLSNEIKAEVETLFLSKDSTEWIALAKQFDACLTPILELNELEKEQYHIDRNNFIEVEHPEKGKLKMINQPIKFAAFDKQTFSYPPEMGADNDEILNNL
ncbi:MAG: CoA transferase [Chitinophagales bacterium]|nr:CoA transferase [Chitinophagales bacterium]